ncbi:MAG TPA: hypothetical protein VGW35_17460 [Methylomirabilota bacterium]|jgi:Cu/Ag efflux protein CusF|nr:hypothetical protein [Methylomirabilota bacterium]
MRKPTLAAVALVVVVAVIASGSFAAAPKAYQFTGTVTLFDPKAKKIAVDKDGDVWEFSTDGLKDLKVKKGDKVTVNYQMVAKKIETK